MEEKKQYFLAKYDDCFAILTEEQPAFGGFMADKQKIYETPNVDGYIGFLKVVACTEQKGNLPLINKEQIFIPTTVSEERIWFAHLVIDDSGSLKIRNGFVNLIGIDIPKNDEVC